MFVSSNSFDVAGAKHFSASRSLGFVVAAAPACPQTRRCRHRCITCCVLSRKSWSASRTTRFQT
jgi:hypothetical protein